MKEENEFLEPGMVVRNPDCPQWGTGQIQSRIGTKITVMFQNNGKTVIDGDYVSLETIYNPKKSMPS